MSHIIIFLHVFILISYTSHELIFIFTTNIHIWNSLLAYVAFKSFSKHFQTVLHLLRSDSHACSGLKTLTRVYLKIGNQSSLTVTSYIHRYILIFLSTICMQNRYLLNVCIQRFRQYIITRLRRCYKMPVRQIKNVRLQQGCVSGREKQLPGTTKIHDIPLWPKLAAK